MLNKLENRDELYVLLRELASEHSKFEKTDAGCQKKILFYLFTLHNHTCALSDLATFLKVSNARISVVIRTLHDKKYISLCNDKKDKRKTIVSLTTEGEKMLQKNHKGLDKQYDVFFKPLTANERQQLCNILRKIMKTVKSMKEKCNV
jgi:DNA-binding MarR family transcriptional regulator